MGAKFAGAGIEGSNNEHYQPHCPSIHNISHKHRTQPSLVISGSGNRSLSNVHDNIGVFALSVSHHWPIYIAGTTPLPSGLAEHHPKSSVRGSRSFGTKNVAPLEVIVFTGFLARLSELGWGVRDKPQRRGRKPCSWAKYYGKHGQNQGFPSTVCVDEDLRFFPQLDRLPAVRRFLFHYCGNPSISGGARTWNRNSTPWQPRKRSWRPKSIDKASWQAW